MFPIGLHSDLFLQQQFFRKYTNSESIGSTLVLPANKKEYIAKKGLINYFKNYGKESRILTSDIINNQDYSIGVFGKPILTTIVETADIRNCITSFLHVYDIAALSGVCMFGSFIAAHTIPQKFDCFGFEKFNQDDFYVPVAVYDWLSQSVFLEIPNDLCELELPLNELFWSKTFPNLKKLNMDLYAVDGSVSIQREIMNRCKSISNQLESLILHLEMRLENDKVYTSENCTVFGAFHDWNLSNLKHLVVYDDYNALHSPYHPSLYQLQLILVNQKLINWNIKN